MQISVLHAQRCRIIYRWCIKYLPLSLEFYFYAVNVNFFVFLHCVPPFRCWVLTSSRNRGGGERHRSWTSVQVGPRLHIDAKTPGRHEAARAHENVLSEWYWYIVPSWLEYPGGGATLFLTGEDYGRCEKAKRTRRYLLGHRRILKKGRLYHTPRKSNFSKGKRRLEMQYFKTAILRRKSEFNGLVVSASTVATKKKRDWRN